MTDNVAPAKVIPTRRRRHVKRAMWGMGSLFLLWFLVAYLLMPLMWRRAMGGRLDLSDEPRITHTKDGIPGDPLNLAVIASEDELCRAMSASGWHTADKVTMGSSGKIATATIFGRPYKTAPVSDLFLYSRRQDVAFQQADGNSPRKRHHVRFWRTRKVDDCGRPIWVGAATYDSKVGFSHTTGQITHHIAPDVDTERDKVLADLKQSGLVAALEWRDGFHDKVEGRNGGGDRYYTDGRLAVATLLWRDVTE